jgi:DNA mismatch repair protein MutL
MNADAFVDYFKRMAPTQKGFVFEQVKAAMDDAPEQLPAWEQAEQNAQQPAAVLREQGVLQVHKSYLVTQDESGIIIIDQHALHERVMFEELRHRVLGKNLESQRLLMPATVRANAARQAMLDDLRPLLEQIGIEAEPLGPESIAVHAFPTLLFEKHVDPAQFVDELLDKAADGAFDTSGPTISEAALHEVLDMMSCKAAVKAGDHLTSEELADLLKRREDIERSSNCPHGRPTTIRLSLRDLERQFMRS